MPRSIFRQDTQVRKSDTFDDTLSAGSTLQSGSTSLESDLNAVRSQLKRFLRADEAGNWYEDVPTVNSKKRGIAALNTDLDDVEEKRVLFRAQVLTDVAVPSSQNYVVLSVSGSEAPSQTAAVDTGSAEGAVVATLAGDVGSHALTEVTGPDAISPKNLCLVVDATTGDPISSSNRQVFALIQAENGVADGNTFNDTDKQVQLSFVRVNSAGNDLEACPVADIESKTINYSYVRRVKFDSIPESAFLTGTFLDQVPTAVSVTLDNAVDNQVGAVTQTDRNIEWRITDTYALRFQDSTGGTNLLAIIPNSAGDEVEINIDTLDINNVNPADFAQSIEVDTTGTKISVGTVAGQVDSAGALTLKSAASGDLTIDASGEVLLTDGNRSGSGFGVNLKLTDTSTEWDNYETLFGEVSLLNAIVQAAGKENRTKSVARVTSDANPDVNVTGAGGTPNLDAQLADYSGVTFVDDVDVYLNGQLLRNGADASANHDVYPGTAPATGDLKFEFKVKTDDQITLIAWGA